MANWCTACLCVVLSLCPVSPVDPAPVSRAYSVPTAVHSLQPPSRDRQRAAGAEEELAVVSVAVAVNPRIAPRRMKKQSQDGMTLSTS